MRKILPVSIVLALMFLITAVFAQSSSTSVGVPYTGQHAFELVGRIDQQLFNTTAFGYVTYINGVPPETLFGENAPAMMRGEADARITFFGTGMSSSRSVYENIFQAVLPVELTFYYSETPAGAAFDNPDLFKSGTPIATFNLRMQTILNVQEPNVGVLMGSGESTQSLAEAFTLGDAAYTLGSVGTMYDFSLFGQGFRQSTEPLAAHYLIGGHTTMIGAGN